MTEGSSFEDASSIRAGRLRQDDLVGFKSDFDFNFSMSTKNTKFILYLGNKLVTLQPELCAVV